MGIFNGENALGGLKADEEQGYIPAVDTVVHTGLQGVTGSSIKKYKVTNVIEYPAFVIAGEDFELFQVNTLKSMLTETPKDDVVQYHCYVMLKNKRIRLGLLNEDKLKNILVTSVFERYEKRVEYGDGEVITGDDLYALCTVTAEE